MKETTGRRLPAPLYAAGILAVLFAVLHFAVVGCGFLGWTCLFAAAVIVCFWLLRRLASEHPGAAKILRILFLAALILFFAAFAVTEIAVIRAAKQDAPADLDAVIVLGAGLDGAKPSRTLLDRLSRAKTYLEENPDAVCVVTGAKGENEDVSEADAMYGWLTAQGIEESRIYREEKATNTYENLERSEALLESAGLSDGGIGVVTSEYHVYRAQFCAKELGLTVSGIPAKTSNPIFRVNYFIREAFAVWYYVLLK